MSKKVLIISASPRKNGNSDLLCESFKQGALDAGHEVTKIRLQEKKINYCLACYGCRGTKKCVLNDDMEEIIAQLIASDVIVLATPVYFYSMNAQLKAMIDRCLPAYNDIKNKDFYFIATAADSKGAMVRTMEAMEGFTDCLPGAVVKAKIYGEGVYQKGEINNTNKIKEVYKYGKNC